MEAISLLFGLFLVVLLCLVALGAILTALQGITMAYNADPLLALISVLLIFPGIVFGVVYWVTGNNMPQKFMDDLRAKQRKDSGDDQPQPGDHEPDVDPPLSEAGGDFHDNVDHAFVETSPSAAGTASVAAAAEADESK